MKKTLKDTKEKEPQPGKEKYNQSETVVINRSMITFAPYNPRKKNPKVIAELKKNFKRVGFLGGVVWNEVTGNLVSGHKRVECLDLINGYNGTSETDYKIKVEKVNLDQKTEKEQNIFMNSQTVQGDFDMDMLAVILPDIDYTFAGLDDSDLNIIMAQTNFSFPASDSSDIITAGMEAIEKPYQELKEAIKQAKAAQNESIDKHYEEGETYFMVSFDSVDNKVAFLERFGFGSDDKYIKGEVLERNIEETMV